jgi:hypothetical protein
MRDHWVGRLSGLRDHSLSIVFGVLLLAALTGQALTGMAGYNEQALDLGLPQVGPHAKANSPAWAKASGWRRTLYSHSLGLVMGLFFVASWTAQLVAGRSAYNAQQLMDLQAPASWGQYTLAPDFWNRTLQNWQSELLAVGSMVVLSIYLRGRGSPESKPVGTPHAATAVED